MIKKKKKLFSLKFQKAEGERLEKPSHHPYSETLRVKDANTMNYRAMAPTSIQTDKSMFYSFLLTNVTLVFISSFVNISLLSRFLYLICPSVFFMIIPFSFILSSSIICFYFHYFFTILRGAQLQ